MDPFATFWEPTTFNVRILRIRVGSRRLPGGSGASLPPPPPPPPPPLFSTASGGLSPVLACCSLDRAQGKVPMEGGGTKGLPGVTASPPQLLTYFSLY